jgi:hypothetical protein
MQSEERANSWHLPAFRNKPITLLHKRRWPFSGTKTTFVLVYLTFSTAVECQSLPDGILSK